MRISVISTTYNRKELLRQTIESVQRSILNPLHGVSFEHIIYDDASTDGTKDLFDNHAWKDIVYIRSDDNRGQSYGKNIAVEKATGDYIFFLDSDDIVLQRSLYNFANIVLQYPNTQWFVAEFLRVDNNLRYVEGEDYYAWQFATPKEMLTAIFKGEHFIQANTLINKNLFKKVKGFDKELRVAEDIDLYIRFLLIGEMPVFCNFISHLHRIHADNISKDVTLSNHKSHIEVFKEKYRPELECIGLII